MNKTNYSDEEYTQRREKAKTLYAKFTPVHCPALNNNSVVFNSEGFNHILYKSARTQRLRNDQIIRFTLLPLAREIIELSTTYQEYEEKLQEVMVEKHGKRQQITKEIRYWGFIAIRKLEKRYYKAKVIVKRIGEGNLMYWSIIPFWSTTSHGDFRFRIFASGNLVED